MLPNTTIDSEESAVKPYKTGVFDEWLTWKACGGLLIDEEENHIYRMSLTKFCERFKIAKSTANFWRTHTPNLAQRIEQRRNEIAPLARVSMVYNQMFITALQTKDLRAAVDAQKTYAGHFGNLQLPVQRQDVRIQGGLAEVLNAAEQDGIIEGEIVEPSAIDSTASGQDPSTLPPAS